MTQDPSQRCGICQGATGAFCTTFNVGPADALGFDCEACGRYKASRTAWVTYLDKSNLSALERAALSHQVRVSDRSIDLPLVTTFWIDEFLKNARLPAVTVQAANLMRAIGDHQSTTGQGYFIDGVTDTSLVGAFNSDTFYQLLNETRDKGFLRKLGEGTRSSPRGSGTLKHLPKDRRQSSTIHEELKPRRLLHLPGPARQCTPRRHIRTAPSQSSSGRSHPARAEAVQHISDCTRRSPDQNGRKTQARGSSEAVVATSTHHSRANPD